jgi:predicted DNA-binding ribbon-helix-helix protein
MPWTPDSQRPLARKRHTIRLYPGFYARLSAIAEKMGLPIAEYIETHILEDEKKLANHGPTAAAIGRKMVKGKL